MTVRLCLREATTFIAATSPASVSGRQISYLESFSPVPIHLRFSYSLTDCLSLYTSDDSSLQLIWFLYLQAYLYLQRCQIFSCKIVGIEGSIVGVDVLFPIHRSTSFGSSVRALVKIGSYVVRLRRQRSSVASSGSGGKKWLIPRLDPCSLIVTRGRWRAVAYFLDGLPFVFWTCVLDLRLSVNWACVALLSCNVLGLALLGSVPLIKFPEKKKSY